MNTQRDDFYGICGAFALAIVLALGAAGLARGPADDASAKAPAVAPVVVADAAEPQIGATQDDVLKAFGG